MIRRMVDGRSDGVGWGNRRQRWIGSYLDLHGDGVLSEQLASLDCRSTPWSSNFPSSIISSRYSSRTTFRPKKIWWRISFFSSFLSRGGESFFILFTSEGFLDLRVSGLCLMDGNLDFFACTLCFRSTTFTMMIMMDGRHRTGTEHYR